MRSGAWNRSRITSCPFTKFLIMARTRRAAHQNLRTDRPVSIRDSRFVLYEDRPPDAIAATKHVVRAGPLPRPRICKTRPRAGKEPAEELPDPGPASMEIPQITFRPQ